MSDAADLAALTVDAAWSLPLEQRIPLTPEEVETMKKVTLDESICTA